jgi:methionyl-tRNA synthetase
MDRYDPQTALDALWELVTRANKYVEESAPWTLAREERAGDASAGQRLDTVLSTLAECLRVLATLLEPFLPSTAEQMKQQLGLAAVTEPWLDRARWGTSLAGVSVGTAQPLFPRLEPAATSA